MGTVPLRVADLPSSDQVIRRRQGQPDITIPAVLTTTEEITDEAVTSTLICRVDTGTDLQDGDAVITDTATYTAQTRRSSPLTSTEIFNLYAV